MLSIRIPIVKSLKIGVRMLFSFYSRGEKRIIRNKKNEISIDNIKGFILNVIEINEDDCNPYTIHIKYVYDELNQKI